MILRFCLTQTSSYNFSTDDDLHTPLHILPVQMSVIYTWAKEIDTIYRNIIPSLSINYVAMSNDMGKRLPQLYYIKMKISYDLGFIAIGVTMAT